MGIAGGQAKKALAVKERLDTPYGIVLSSPSYTRYHVELGELRSVTSRHTRIARLRIGKVGNRWRNDRCVVCAKNLQSASFFGGALFERRV